MSDRRRFVELGAPVLLLVALAVASIVPTPGGLRLASADAAMTEGWTSVLDELRPEPTILVAFDPDLGTYPEIRPTVRIALADLLAREARLAFVALTPEGRALLLAELARLERLDVNSARLLDLGFVPGAEAAIVSLARGPEPPAGSDGSIARDVAANGPAALDALLVVGGNDIGPRSWVEQYIPRVDPLPALAITPTVLLPEVQPYLATGQLDALLGTPRDGAAYRGAAELGSFDRLREVQEPPAAGVLLGVVVAIAVLGHGWIGRVGRSAGGGGREQERP